MAESRQAPPTAPRALRAPTSNQVMRKGRRWRALLQTCNMTPCSLYRPTSHSSTSSISLMAATAIRAGLPGGHAEPAPEPHRSSSDVMSIILQLSLVNASSPYLRPPRWRWWVPDYRGLSSPGRGGRCRDRPCGFGVGRGGLRIRPESVIEESAESCGNAPAFNAGGILPCAEGPALHMGEHRQEADDSRKP